MVRLPAKDGGHTAFTDHRISRHPEDKTGEAPSNDDLVAWREPPASLSERNLALALVTTGMEEHDSGQVVRAYRMLNRLESGFSNDPATLTAMGTILLTAKQAGEAERRFQRALALRPGYAPYEVNLANALMDEGKFPAGTRHLERAVELDPLLTQAVLLLRQAYLSQGERAKAETLTDRYRAAMGMSFNKSK
jgi:predicted Zn-dependent protease